MREDNENDALEEKLQRAYASIQPDPAFAARLRAQVAGQPVHQPAKLRWPRLSLRLALVAGALALVLVAVLAAGPEPLLARARALFSFIPGVGFVEEPNAYHLCQPVQTSQNGIELKIERGGGSNGDLHVAGQIIGLETAPFRFNLEDENGQPVHVNGGGGGGGGGDGGGQRPVTSFDFDFNLPETRDRYTFVLQPFQQEDTILRLPFALCPGAESTLASPGEPAQVIYLPEGASTSGKGIQVQVMKVAQSAQATGVQLKTTTQDEQTDFTVSVSDFYFDPVQGVLPNLVFSDEQGREYAQHPLHLLDSTGDPSDSTMEFDPLAADAKKVTLRIHSMMLIYSGNVPFRFPVPDSMKDGQPVELNGESYTLDGFEIHLLQAVYARENVQTGPNEFKDAETIELTARIQAPDTGMQIYSICPTIELQNAGYQCSPEPGTGLWKLKMIFTEGIPGKGIEGTIGHISADLSGPWELTWEVPER